VRLNAKASFSAAGQTPQPYARPMLDEMRGQVLGIVADAIKDEL
jgi:hypothetical protein